MIGVILAAGHGTRAYPYSKGVPKSMVDVAGKPNLERVVAIMRDKLHVVRIVVVVGAYGDQIRQYFEDGARFGVAIVYVENDAIERGLGYSLLLTRSHVDDYACVMLADECYVDSNHEEILATDYRSCVATCAVQVTNDTDLIRQNYAVYAERGFVRRLVEKPKHTDGALLGLGTFVVSPRFYEHLEAALATESLSDPVSVLGRLCEAGERVGVFHVRGPYVNINNRDALNLAAIVVRAHEFPACTLGLALMMKGSIEETSRSIDEFRALGRFHQIVLVLPPGVASPNTEPSVECVSASSSRYGDMMRTGFDAVSADILICAQSDGSCRARDVPKFIEYLKEADFVVGTRTTRQLIEQGTNMRGIVRFAHILLAKLLEIVWWGYEPRFTDTGCGYRAVWNSTYRLIRGNLQTSGPEYSVEMFLETLKCRMRIIEIPVSFAVRRKGVKEPDQTLRAFVSMLRLIVGRRFS
ncbi:MAG: NTP transferase domain-containing protein [Acidobacteria bacterium]|nr:NTP transferase domain-containing protein [Acidobacteriota bacterium]